MSPSEPIDMTLDSDSEKENASLSSSPRPRSPVKRKSKPSRQRAAKTVKKGNTLSMSTNTVAGQSSMSMELDSPLASVLTSHTGDLNVSATVALGNNAGVAIAQIAASNASSFSSPGDDSGVAIEDEPLDYEAVNAARAALFAPAVKANRGLSHSKHHTPALMAHLAKLDLEFLEARLNNHKDKWPAEPINAAGCEISSYRGASGRGASIKVDGEYCTLGHLVAFVHQPAKDLARLIKGELLVRQRCHDAWCVAPDHNLLESTVKAEARDECRGTSIPALTIAIGDRRMLGQTSEVCCCVPCCISSRQVSRSDKGKYSSIAAELMSPIRSEHAEDSGIAAILGLMDSRSSKDRKQPPPGHYV